MVTLSKLDLILSLIIIALTITLIYRHLRVENTSMSVAQEIPIHNIIERVRAELQQADANRLREGLPALFEVKDFDLEIQFVARNVRRADGQLRTELVAISGGSETSTERIQKITLHLTAVAPGEITVPPRSPSR